MSNRYHTCQIISKEPIPEQIKKQYRGFLPGRHTVKNLLKWMESDWRKSAPPTETAQQVLKETDQTTASRFLVDLLQDNTTPTLQDEVAWLLGQINPGDEQAIAFLVESIQNYPICITEPYFFKEQLDRLWEIDPNNKTIINFLVEIIQTIEVGELVLTAADSLAKFDPGNKAAITLLYEEIQSEENKYCRCLFAYTLGKIDINNELAINTITEFIHNVQDKLCSYQASLINSLQETSIVDLSDLCELWDMFRIACESLGEINPGNQIAITALFQWLNPRDEFIVHNSIRVEAAESLSKIQPSNELVISTIIETIESSEDDDLIELAVIYLQEFAINDQKAIATLEKLALTEDYGYSIEESLGTIDPGNETAITNLLALILNGEDEDELVAGSLERILQGNHFPKVVAALKHYMTDQALKKNIHFYTACHDVIWRCAENMSYPEFYHAWHGESSTVQNSENLIADIASQLQPTNKSYPIVINCEALEDETEISAISQELCNQIYLTVFPNNPEIPAVNNAPQFKRIVLKIKKRLQTQHLALIINNCEPNQALITFCRKVTDVLHIAWITDQFLEAPLTGFSSAHPNLVSAIKSWINEIE
ncbi:HEAT repeat domain-containing protein [Nostoc sp.]|uniref:HEAT repeat domain-containing protein n=1 Tax=Nostoc sp. TaxID=1180 RepID=UPI002FFA0A0E